MHSTRTLTENRNVANLRATPDTKHRASLSPAHPHPHACHNHPDKAATHSLLHPQSHQQLPYCEKCSIMLASKGHNIIKISKNPSAKPTALKSPIRSHRQAQIEDFLAELSWHIEEISRRHAQSEEILRGSQAHFAGVLDEVTAYFQSIEEVLEVQKYLSYNAILNQRAAAEAEIRLARESMEREVEELVGIGNDIQNNMEAVEQVEAAIYDSIMDNYHHKAAIAYDFHQLDFPPLSRPSVVLPEIPKMLYSLADKLSLRNDSPRETLTMPPQAAPKQSLSGRSNVPRHQSCENSRRQNALPSSDQRPPAKKSLTNFLNLKNTESIDDKEKEIVFSFESNDGEQHPLQKALFGRNRQTFHPQEMIFRESLSLTQIRENDEEMEPNGRRYGGMLEQTIPIPEEMMASQQSIGGYFATNTLNYSPRELNERGEETETLLIC